MKLNVLALLLVWALCSCSHYEPLNDVSLRQPVRYPGATRSGVQVKFLGNTTLYITDGRTGLLVDGFLSRPGKWQSLFGKIGPDRAEIDRELGKANIRRVDAVLLGHAHCDHALDSTAVADEFGSAVVGSTSVAEIYRGSHVAGRPSRMIVVPTVGRQVTFGKFVVDFVPSRHVGSHNFLEREVEGQIREKVTLPAHFSDFKCGDVFALCISHPEGRIVITTTAGAQEGKLQGHKADALFLGVGLLSKEKKSEQDFYWHEVVDATHPRAIFPIHWDDFTRKLSDGLRARTLADNLQEAMGYVKGRADGRPVRVLNAGESVWVRGSRVYCP